MSGTEKTESPLPFSDAVVAIAMTLLVLPLIDLGATGSSGTMGALVHRLVTQWPTLLSLAISFFVIARLWWAQHVLVERLDRWTPRLVAVNTVWLFSIVLLPVTTSLSTAFSPSWLVSLLYVGTMTFSSAMLSVIARMALTELGDVPAKERYYGNLATTAAFALALVICMLVPYSYYFPLILLAFTGIVDRRVKRRLEPSSAAVHSG